MKVEKARRKSTGNFPATRLLIMISIIAYFSVGAESRIPKSESTQRPLKVNERPGRPKIVQTTEDTVMLQLVKSRTKGFQQYIIHTMIKKGSGWNKFRTTFSNVTAVTIFKLTPFSTYLHCVTEDTEYGETECSENVISHTDRSAPGESPTFTSVSALNSTSISVKFKSNNDSINGEFRGHKITWKAKNAKNLTGGDVIRDYFAQEYNITGLVPYTPYIITLSLENVQFSGPQASTICSTAEGVPSEPNNVSVISVSNDTIVLNWHGPKHPHGKIKHFKVFSKNGGGKVEEYSTNETQFVITKRKPFTKYTLWVTVENGFHESAPSNKTSVQTDFGPPSQLTLENLRCDENRTISFELTMVDWKVEVPIKLYVEYRMKGQTKFAVIPINLAPSNLTLQINLRFPQPAGNYEMHVRGYVESLNTPGKRYYGKSSNTLYVWVSDNCRKSDQTPNGLVLAFFFGGGLLLIFFIVICTIRLSQKCCRCCKATEAGNQDAVNEEGIPENFPMTAAQRRGAPTSELAGTSRSSQATEAGNQDVVDEEEIRENVHVAPGQMQDNPVAELTANEGTQYPDIKGPGQEVVYLALDSLSPSEICKVVWDRDVRIIVQLSSELISASTLNSGRPFDKYWPSEDQPQLELDGLFIVDLIQEDIYITHCERTFSLRLNKKDPETSKRIVSQFEFINWPINLTGDHWFPVFEFLGRSTANMDDRDVIAVHSSAGDGSIGTFVILSELFQSFAKSTAWDQDSYYNFLTTLAPSIRPSNTQYGLVTTATDAALDRSLRPPPLSIYFHMMVSNRDHYINLRQSDEAFPAEHRRHDSTSRGVKFSERVKVRPVFWTRLLVERFPRNTSEQYVQQIFQDCPGLCGVEMVSGARDMFFMQFQTFKDSRLLKTENCERQKTQTCTLKIYFS